MHSSHVVMPSMNRVGVMILSGKIDDLNEP